MIKSRTFKTGILASSKLLTSIVGLVAAAILARVLDRHDYATYRQTFLAYSFVAPLLMLGLTNSLFFFLPSEKIRPRGVTVENILMLGFMGCLFSGFLLLGGNQLLAHRFSNPDLVHTLRLLAPYPLFVLPAASFTACMMARDRVLLAASFNIISRLVMITGILVAILFWCTPEGAVVGMVVAACLVSAPAIGIMLHVTRGGPWHPTLKGIWCQVAYSVPVSAAGVVGRININLDKIIVSSLVSPETFAVYANGAMEIPLVAILTGSATAVLIPEMTRMVQDGDLATCHELWKRAIRKTAVGIFPCMIFLFILAQDIMTVLFSADYAASAAPFRIYLLLLPMRIAHYGVIFLATGKTSLLLWRSIFGLSFNLVLNILLVRKFGYLGAAVATVLVVYLWSIPFSFYWIQRLTGWKMRRMLPYRHLMIIVLVCLLAGLPTAWIVAKIHHSAILRIIVGGTVYCAILIPLFERMKYIELTETLRTMWRRVAT